MTDHNLTNQAAEQAAKDEALLNSCAEYLFNKFDWKNRINDVTEYLSTEPKTLDNALAAFMMMDSLTLRLALDKVAMHFCERSAEILTKKYGANWLVELEGADYE